MNKLEIARKQINEIDSQIVKLFEQRMNAVKMVSEYKIQNNLPINDISREKILLETNLNMLSDRNLKKYYEIVFQSYLKASKEFQKDLLKK